MKQDIESEKQKGKYIFEQRLKHRSSLTYGYDLQRARSYSRQQDFNIKLEAITTKENKGVESEPTKCITQGEGGMGKSFLIAVRLLSDCSYTITICIYQLSGGEN